MAIGPGAWRCRPSALRHQPWESQGSGALVGGDRSELACCGARCATPHPRRLAATRSALGGGVRTEGVAYLPCATAAPPANRHRAIATACSRSSCKRCCRSRACGCPSPHPLPAPLRCAGRGSERPSRTCRGLSPLVPCPLALYMRLVRPRSLRFGGVGALRGMSPSLISAGSAAQHVGASATVQEQP